jgi:hypothetical protein
MELALLSSNFTATTALAFMQQCFPWKDRASVCQYVEAFTYIKHNFSHKMSQDKVFQAVVGSILKLLRGDHGYF